HRATTQSRLPDCRGIVYFPRGPVLRLRKAPGDPMYRSGKGHLLAGLPPQPRPGNRQRTELTVPAAKRSIRPAWRSQPRPASGLLLASRVDDGGDQTGSDVVDVPGDADVLRDLLRPQHPVDVGGHGAGRVQDGGVGQGPLVGADALGESVAQVVV